MWHTKTIPKATVLFCFYRYPLIQEAVDERTLSWAFIIFITMYSPISSIPMGQGPEFLSLITRWQQRALLYLVLRIHL